MPDGQPHTALLANSGHRVQSVRGRPPATQSADQALITARLDRIMTLIAVGRLHDAREACADLLFCFQSLIVARPELCQRVVAALQRCQGNQLLRRLSIATHCDTA
jgi:hypothetical protein